jgi:hypothetical protein
MMYGLSGRTQAYTSPSITERVGRELDKDDFDLKNYKSIFDKPKA